MTAAVPRLLGALLAGGQSRRFGTDKAAALLHGRTLLDRAAEQLSRHVDAMVVCGREMGALTGVADRPAGIGPLGGLNAALHHARDNGFSAVLTTACDMPLFPGSLADALVGRGPAVFEGLHIVGFWPSALAPTLDTYLAATDHHSVAGWADHVGARRILLPDLDLPNINTPEDLAALERRWIEPDVG